MSPPLYEEAPEGSIALSAANPSSGSGEVHRLDFEVGIKSFKAAFATETGLLETTEWHFCIDDESIYRQASGAHTPCNLEAMLGIGRVDCAVQAILRVVGDAHGRQALR